MIDVIEVGASESRPLFLLELVEGVSLDQLMQRVADRRARFPLDLAIFVVTETLEALAGARAAAGHDGLRLAMIHGQLTAREVLLSWRGEVKVGDFELHALQTRASGVRLRGIASTMSPEVARGLDADARSDVFSAGVLLHELLVGPRFPRSASQSQTVQLVREGHVETGLLRPDLPEALVHVLRRATETDPEDRYPNASAMLFDLRRVGLSMGVGDGRCFLRSALEHEWASEVSEVTVERSLPTVPARDEDPLAYPRISVPRPARSGVRLGGGGDDFDGEDDDDGASMSAAPCPEDSLAVAPPRTPASLDQDESSVKRSTTR